MSNFSRRDVLKTLSIAGAYSATSTIGAEAAGYAHALIANEKTRTPQHGYSPKYFQLDRWETLRALCDAIIPADHDSGGALEAGSPEFIDLLTSENEDWQLRLGGGMMWLDSACKDRFGSIYLSCSPDQRTELLDAIAFRRNIDHDASLRQGVEFFALLRNLTLDGFVTSKIGIKYLGYIGNTFVAEFPGCPPVEGV